MCVYVRVTVKQRGGAMAGILGDAGGTALDADSMLGGGAGLASQSEPVTHLRAAAGRRQKKGLAHFSSRNLMLAHNALVVAKPTSKRERSPSPA